ncbi:MAG: 30S ribosomal protein S8 [Gammaproteobacteria bacterium]|nr:30S ribosomal protein S8 [Gammaproteobacteria bacterium]CAJ2376154.1 MAG: 30S ribosomal subunit protein S8 [Arenicellales bacterium IbO2]MDA7962427.1 30S ribosomal protein S8 [Gammaproteobacteria bacterium]MDA7968447.1 30S ribosomal protein S8 [Gammaproteobacteria bacterium]MDA7970736.1 30S ribosomal protein S8 [Gammaproteobacteria bacterium]
MSMSDPIADMLTRIRNGSRAGMAGVSMPASRAKAAVAEVLRDEGYIAGFRVEGDGARRRLNVELKYFEGAPVIEEIRRVSSPGCRVYARSGELPSVRGGLGVALVSTSKGVMSDKSARERQLGGEVLCTVF